MTSTGKPSPPERNLAPPLWALLSDNERAQVRRVFGLPNTWSPRREQPATLEQRLEKLEELGRIMKMPPNRITQWKEELIVRVEPVEGE